jgi:hypothetical protein
MHNPSQFDTDRTCPGRRTVSFSNAQGGGFIRNKRASAGRFNLGEKLVFRRRQYRGLAVGRSAAVSLLRH